MSLKIGFILTPPYATACALDAKCHERGCAIDAATFACEYLKVNCIFAVYPGEYGQANDAGQGTGLIGAIQKGEFDATMPLINPNYRRSLAVAFSSSYFYIDLVLATRIPDPVEDALNWSFLYAFQWPVILAYFFALATVALLITGVNPRSPNEGHSFFNWISSLFNNSSSLITQKYTQSVLHFIPLRLLISIWGLSIIILGSTYINLLISRKVILNNNLPFTDFETFVQCLEEKRCRFITHDLTTSSYQRVTAPGPEWNIRITKALIDNPTIVAPADQVPEIILQEKRQFLVWPWLKEGILYNIKDSICDFYIMDTEFKHSSTFATRKNSSILPKLSQLGLIFQENGLAESLQQKYRYKIYSVCDNIGKRISSNNNEGLSCFVTYFAFYGCGIVIATGGFVIEVAITFIFEKLALSVITNAMS